MYFPRPKSFLKLILIGFSFVALPLTVALAAAAIYMDSMADQSQHAVYQAARATQTSRMLVEQITTMERTARQYHVLGDKALFNAYREIHDQFQNTVDALQKLPLDVTLRNQLGTVVLTERDILKTLSENRFNSRNSKRSVERFIEVSEGARTVLNGSNRVIDREVEEMHDIASSAQTLLFWFALTLIPATIVIVVGFTILIARPIRQIDQAISSLGDGVLDATIEVAGPEDLVLLGQRLDWLRLRLAEVEQEKVKFLRHVSHELKTPLTALREGTDLLADGVVGDLIPEQKEVVRILGTNTTQLQSLIEDLLNFSVAHLKQPELCSEYVNLEMLMKRVLMDQKLAIMAKQLKLRMRLEPLTVKGDKEKLRIVLDNLLSNAVKFSPREGEIKLLVRKLNSEAIVEIGDSGPGIKQWEKERVFEAFYQGESRAQGHIKGTGLGLSIARDYVEAHGGTIAVEDSPHDGAHLSFRLPLELALEAL